jgi:hypothetical protein
LAYLRPHEVFAIKSHNAFNIAVAKKSQIIDIAACYVTFG